MNNSQFTRPFLSISRLFYSLFLLIFIVIFTARFACEKLDCSVSTFKSWIWGNDCEQYCANCQVKAKKEFCDECEKCKSLKPEWNIRDAFDEAGFTIIGVCSVLLILIYKNYNGLFLLKSITKLSLFGSVEWELEKLHEDVTKLENDRFKETTLDSQQEIINIQQKILIDSNTPNETLIGLNLEIEKTIKEIYKLGFYENKFIPNSISSMIDKLKSEKLIDVDLGNVVEHYFEVKQKDSIYRNGKNTISIIDLGKRILSILNTYAKILFNKKRKFWGNPKNIKIDRSKIEEVSLDNITLFTTISVSDANNNYFPLDNIGVENFTIYERCGNEERKAKVSKIVALEDTQTRILITLALDCSGSMHDNGKIEKSKEAVIALLKELEEYSNLECSVGLYFITTKTQGYAGDKFYSKNEFGELMKIVNNIKAEGKTPLWESLSLIVDNYATQIDNGYQIIICLSDGLDSNQTKITYNIVKSKVIKAKIPFIFIGYGEENYSNMIELAEQSGAGQMGIGHFIKVMPNEIERIFEDIARSIRKSYKIYWKPTFKEHKKNIDVRVKIRYKTPFGKITTEDNLDYIL